jgi:hypothetical protein
MATKPTDIAAQRDKLGAEIQAIYKELEAAKQKVRDNPAADRGALGELKQEYAERSNEYVELARAVALQVGGKNYAPPVT